MALISAEVRSRMMRSIRKTDARPERTVRQMIWALGIRYRLHGKELPGSPDIVFRRTRKAIFVHGCFWHQHKGCRLAKLPSARPEYWLPKLARNQQRDKAALTALAGLGWETLVVVLVEARPLRRFFCIASGRLFDPVRGCRRSLAIGSDGAIQPTIFSDCNIRDLLAERESAKDSVYGIDFTSLFFTKPKPGPTFGPTSDTATISQKRLDCALPSTQLIGGSILESTLGS